VTPRDLLSAGTKIRLLKQEEQLFYTAAIKTADEDGFTIDGEVSGIRNLNIELGEECKMAVLGSDAVYHFSSRVLEISGENGAGGFRFAYPTELLRQQRRGYVRLHCRLPVYCWSLAEAREILEKIIIGGEVISLEDPRWRGGLLEELNSCLPAKQYLTLDLSAGGLRMITTELPRRQERMLLKICTQENQFFLVEAVVIRITPLSGAVKKYRVSVIFLNISPGLRERIIRYIFTIMRKRI